MALAARLSQFLDALDLAAAKSGRQLGDVVRLVAASGGPRLSAASEAGPLQCPGAARVLRLTLACPGVE
jgi:hypothetical protein